MMRPTIQPGDWLVVCDVSGFRVPASQIRKQWDGALVYAPLWESRHPQDLIRGVRDVESVPFARPKTDPVFLATNAVTKDSL